MKSSLLAQIALPGLLPGLGRIMHSANETEQPQRHVVD